MTSTIGRQFLLQCDGHQSVFSSGVESRRAYGCFGWSTGVAEQQIAFNGLIHEPVGGYLLGNGYRLYSVALQRFCSPDSLSPFREGGLNAYTYCNGDPVNAVDPSGHARFRAVPSKFIVPRVGDVKRLRRPAIAPKTVTQAAPRPSVLEHLDNPSAWVPLREEHARLTAYAGRTLDSPDWQQGYMKKRWRKMDGELTEIEARFGEMFEGYNIKNGLTRSVLADPRLSASLMLPVGHQEFFERVVVQHFNSQRQIFSPSSATAFLSRTSAEHMAAVRGRNGLA